MKLLAYILSFVVLLLSLSPCIDEHHDNDMQHYEHSQSNDNGHQDNPDHCSPFCTCHCCQTSFNIPLSVNWPGPVTVKVQYFIDNEYIRSVDLSEFFIPPKA